jgi:hypothetical protein
MEEHAEALLPQVLRHAAAPDELVAYVDFNVSVTNDQGAFHEDSALGILNAANFVEVSSLLRLSLPRSVPLSPR